MNHVPCSSPHAVAARPADHGPSGSLGNSSCPPSSLTSAPSTCPLLTVFQPEHTGLFWSQSCGMCYSFCPRSSCRHLLLFFHPSTQLLKKCSPLSRHHHITLFGTKNGHVFYVTLSSPDYNINSSGQELCVSYS